MALMMSKEEQFFSCKHMTEPYMEIPRRVQDMLDISAVYPDGIFCIGKKGARGTCRFDKTYLFSDINYVNRDDGEKKGTLLLLCALFNSMSIDFKISVCNEPRHSDNLLPKAEKENALTEAYGEIFTEALEKGTPELSKRHYFTVSVRRKSHKAAVTFFNVLEASVGAVFTKLGSSLVPLSPEERLHAVYHFFHYDGRADFNYESVGKNRRDFRNEIVPYKCSNRESHLQFGDDGFMQILFAPSFPDMLDESKFMSQLHNVPFPVTVTVDCACVPREYLNGFLQSKNFSNDNAIAGEMEANARRNLSLPASYKKAKTKEELENAMSWINENDENGFFMQLLVAVRGRTMEELKENVETIRMSGRQNNVKFIPDYDRQIQAANTVLPIGARRTDHMRSILTSSLAAFHPFYAADLIMPGGKFYGINRLTKNILQINRKKLLNGNGVLIGHSGSGKSMLLKLTEAGQTLLFEKDDVIMIDPQNEMEGIPELFGGTFFDISSQSGIYFNPFEVPEEILYGDDVRKQNLFIGGKAEFAEAFIYSCLKGSIPNGIHKTLIVRCVKTMYTQTFEEANPKQPTLADFVEILKKQPEPEARLLYISLEAYVDGTFDMFSKESTFDISKRFLVFGIKNVPEAMRGTVMLTIMHVLSQRMEYNVLLQRATHFIVDEGQYVCMDDVCAAELEKAFITFRKFGGINTLCLQNTTAALANPKIETMVSNCAFKIILDQGGSDRNALARIMELSEREFEELGIPKVGQCLISCDGKIYQCDAEISKDNLLYRTYNTNFHEKAEAKETVQCG